MAALAKILEMPNGNQYEFVGKQWYGVCNTLANVQTKTVTISGFKSSDLVAGVRVTVNFKTAQIYNGIPYLNINNTGAKAIYCRAESGATSQAAGQYEWDVDSMITFTYTGGNTGYWVIDNGAHADTSYYGKVKLSNIINESATTALTPSAVNSANFQTRANLVTSVSSSSTNAQYPSAKLFYDTVGDIETLLAAI